MNVSVRKVSDVKLTSEYLRKGTDVSKLKKSLQSVGLIHPVTVNASNELLAGARRLQAVRELGWEEIPVHVAEGDERVQELMSIDENMVRTALTTMEIEKYLNRGRELYESLNPDANKVRVSVGSLSAEERLEQKVMDAADEDSFAAVTAEKTGLSRSVIQSAINRDEFASHAVKDARNAGELNATKTNEIIRLDLNIQEDVLPLIADKTVKETRRIVAAALEGGLEAAIEASEQVVPLPREYSQMLSPMKRVNKSISRILVEELCYEGPEKQKINNELISLKNNLLQYFRMVGIDEE
ncbi:MAG: ParB N-terminal domain-containing protein [bacterium]|nr:ParB N-terminal domain-containing protein [bacterium]